MTDSAPEPRRDVGGTHPGNGPFCPGEGNPLPRRSGKPLLCSFREKRVRRAAAKSARGQSAPKALRGGKTGRATTTVRGEQAR